jgi:transposase-like protein
VPAARPRELAQEFEPTAQSIRNWVGQANCDAGRRDNGLTTAEREELNQHWRQHHLEVRPSEDTPLTDGGRVLLDGTNT